MNQAQAVVEQLKKHGDTITQYLDKAAEHYQLDDNVAAEQLLSQAYQLLLKYPNATVEPFYLSSTLAIYCNLLISSEQFELAIEVGEKVISLSVRVANDAEYQDVFQQQEYIHNIAYTWLNIATAYDQLTQYGAATTAYLQSIQQFKPLVKIDKQQYLPELAQTQLALAIVYTEQLQVDAAKPLYATALIVFEQLVQQDAKQHFDDLIQCLTHYCITLFECNESAQGERILQMALDYCQQQIDQAIEENYFDVIDCLKTIGNALHNLTRLESALTALQMAHEVALAIQLDFDKPLIQLAAINNDLASLYIDLEQLDQAQLACEQSLNSFKLLTNYDAAYLPRLATAYSISAELNVKINQPKQAIAFELKAIELWQQIQRKQIVHDSELLPALADALESYGLLIANDWQIDQALTHITQAQQQYITLNQEYGDKFKQGLARTTLSLANLQLKCQEFDLADQNYQLALNHYVQLIALNHEAHISGLITVLNNYANLKIEVGQHNQAINLYRQSLTYSRKQQFQDNILATTLLNLANAYVQIGQFGQALQAIEEAVAIGEQLNFNQPEVNGELYAELLHNAAICNNHAGKTQQAEQYFKAAIEHRQNQPQQHTAQQLVDLATSECYLADFYLDHDHDETNLKPIRHYFNLAINHLEQSKSLISGERLHHNKRWITAAYEYGLAKAAHEQNLQQAYKFSAILRQGHLLLSDFKADDLTELQLWLKAEQKQLFLISQCHYRGATLGLITPDTIRFDVCNTQLWHLLLEQLENDVTQVPSTSSALFQQLPADYQQALTPTSPLTTLISSDGYWHEFPWELIKFGQGDNDYAGLHQPLPRITAIKPQVLNEQYQHKTAPKPTASCFAPNHIGKRPLTGIEQEIEQFKQNIESIGVSVDLPLIGEAASLELFNQRIQQNDIIYFSGHGSIINKEAVLRLQGGYFSRYDLNDNKLNNTLLILNCCHVGVGLEFGGHRSDLTSVLIQQGVKAIIATSKPLSNNTGNLIGKYLFADKPQDLSTAITQLRTALFDVQLDHKPNFEWSQIKLFGNSDITFITP